MHDGIYSARSLAEVLHPILMNNAAPNLKSLGISYEGEGRASQLDDRIVEGELKDLFWSIVRTPLARELKYLALKVVTLGKGDYLEYRDTKPDPKVAIF